MHELEKSIIQELTHIRNELYTNLHQQALAEAELKLAQKAYDEKLAEFEAQNPELVSRRNKAIANYDKANLSLSITRANAIKELSQDYVEPCLDTLPDGFSYESVKTVVYDPQGFRRQALEFFPFLLKLDTEATDKFFKAMVDENNMVPEHIRSLCSVIVFDAINPVINDETIKNLQIVQNYDLSLFADALGDIEENSPADETDGDIWFYCEKCEHEVTKTEKTCQTCGEELLPVDATSTDEDKTVVPLEGINS